MAEPEARDAHDARGDRLESEAEERAADGNDGDVSPDNVPLPDYPVTVIEPGRGLLRLGLGLGELWRYRELVGFLAWRDIKVRYKQTVLGLLWAILQPFLLMVVFTLFFHRFAAIDHRSAVPYPLWSYAGLLPWTYFAQALERSSMSLVANQPLVTKVYFPRLVMPLAGVLSALVDFAVAFAVYAGLLVYYGVTPDARLAYLPALIVFAAAAAFAVGVWLSALNVKYRDVRHAIPFLVQAWLLVSPVAYPFEAVPEAYRTIYGLNPMAGVVEGFRWCLLGQGEFPGRIVWASAGMTAAVLLTGLVYFRRMERTFADVV